MRLIPLLLSSILLSTFIILCAFKPLYVHFFRIAISRTKWCRWVLGEGGAWELFIAVGGKAMTGSCFVSADCWLCIRVNKQCVRVHPHRTSGMLMASVLRRSNTGEMAPACHSLCVCGRTCLLPNVVCEHNNWHISLCILSPLCSVDRASRYNPCKQPTWRTIPFHVCLFLFSTCFGQLCVHHQENNCINTTSAVPSKPAYQKVIYTEWHIPDVVLIQLFSWWWTHSCPKHVENRNKHKWKGIVRQVGYLQGYFLLFICALFNEFPRFSWSGDVGLLTANYCFIYVLHCSYLSQCRIWNYRCIALGVHHNRESEITTVLHYVSFLPLFAYVLTYSVPARLYVKHSANCAVASHSRWCPSCCFVWIPLLSAALPCCVFCSMASQLLNLRISFRNLKQNFKSTICIPPPVFFV